MESHGGVLEVRRTRVNYTILSPNHDPKEIVTPDRQWIERIPIPAGPVRASWPASGLGLVLPFGEGEYSSAIEPFRADLNVPHLNGSSAHAGVVTSAGTYWGDDGTGSLSSVVSSYSGWVRRFTYDGLVRIQGNFSVYLREAHVEAAHGTTGMGPFRTELSNISTPIVARRTLLVEDAFLRLHDAGPTVPPNGELVCAALEGHVSGGFSADQATGAAERSGKETHFRGRVLSLEGSFQLDEAPHPQVEEATRSGLMDARAEGEVRVLGLDFAPAPSGYEPGRVEAIGFWALLGLALAAFAKNLGSLVGLFYARFGKDRALQNAKRDAVYRAVIGSPGLDLSALKEVTSFHMTTVAYHVRVLERVGLVATLRHRRSVRVVPTESFDQRNVPPLLAANDLQLGFVEERVRAGPMPLAELARAVQDRWDMNRRAAYRVIERALRIRLVEKVPESGRRMVVRCPG